MRKSIRLSIFLISFLFLFSIYVPLYACGYSGPEDLDYQYHFFQFESHHYSSNHAKSSPLGSIDPESANLAEWLNYFNDIPNVDDIKQIIYNPAFRKWSDTKEEKVYINTLKNIKKYINGKSVDIDEEYLNNTLVVYLKYNNDTEFINYLIKVLERNSNSDEKLKEKSEMFLNDFSDMYSKSESSFYKIRYAYQMIYTSRYWISYDKTISIYDEYVKPVDTNSIIKYWALSHVAGAYHFKGKALLGSRWNPTENPDSILAGQNDIAKANYLFSQVYDKCPSRRSSALLSFKIKSEEDWDRAVQLCNNDKEIVNLVAMRAINPYSNLFEEMKTIYDIDPTSEHLEMLMKREFFYLEHQLLTKDFESNIFTSRDKVAIEKKQILDIIDGLLVFTEKCINNQIIANNEYWILANGYLNILSGNYKEAQYMFNDIKKKNPNSDVVDQIDVFELLTDIITIDQIGNKIEDDLFLRTKTIDNPYLAELLIKIFGSLYEKQGLSTKAFLCNNSHFRSKYRVQANSRFEQNDHTVFYALVEDYNFELIEKIIEFMNKKDKTEFERFLATSTLNKRVNWSESQPFTKDDLLHILGTIAMRDYRLDDAIMYWEQMSETSSLGLRKNPFEVHIWQNVCDQGKEALEMNYNKLEIAKELRSLLHSLNNNIPSWDFWTTIQKELRSLLHSLNINIPSWDFWTTIQPETYYQIGNYYLNSTYFGHSWEMNAMSRTSSFDPGLLKDDKDYSNKFHLDFKTPMKYYDKCIELSKGINNELAAECTFMAAKCEQFQYISDPDLQQTIPGKYYKYFNILKNDFSETEYYARVIIECKYFNYFVTRAEQ